MKQLFLYCLAIFLFSSSSYASDHADIAGEGMEALIHRPFSEIQLSVTPSFDLGSQDHLVFHDDEIILIAQNENGKEIKFLVKSKEIEDLYRHFPHLEQIFNSQRSSTESSIRTGISSYSLHLLLCGLRKIPISRAMSRLTFSQKEKIYRDFVHLNVSALLGSIKGFYGEVIKASEEKYFRAYNLVLKSKFEKLARKKEEMLQSAVELYLEALDDTRLALKRLQEIFRDKGCELTIIRKAFQKSFDGLLEDVINYPSSDNYYYMAKFFELYGKEKHSESLVAALSFYSKVHPVQRPRLRLDKERVLGSLFFLLGTNQMSDAEKGFAQEKYKDAILNLLQSKFLANVSARQQIENYNQQELGKLNQVDADEKKTQIALNLKITIRKNVLKELEPSYPFWTGYRADLIQSWLKHFCAEEALEEFFKRENLESLTIDFSSLHNFDDSVFEEPEARDEIPVLEASYYSPPAPRDLSGFETEHQDYLVLVTQNGNDTQSEFTVGAEEIEALRRFSTPLSDLLDAHVYVDDAGLRFRNLRDGRLPLEISAPSLHRILCLIRTLRISPSLARPSFRQKERIYRDLKILDRLDLLRANGSCFGGLINTDQEKYFYANILVDLYKPGTGNERILEEACVLYFETLNTVKLSLNRIQDLLKYDKKFLGKVRQAFQESFEAVKQEFREGKTGGEHRKGVSAYLLGRFLDFYTDQLPQDLLTAFSFYSYKHHVKWQEGAKRTLGKFYFHMATKNFEEKKFDEGVRFLFRANFLGNQHASRFLEDIRNGKPQNEKEKGLNVGQRNARVQYNLELQSYKKALEAHQDSAKSWENEPQNTLEKWMSEAMVYITLNVDTSNPGILPHILKETRFEEYIFEEKPEDDTLPPLEDFYLLPEHLKERIEHAASAKVKAESERKIREVTGTGDTVRRGSDPTITARKTEESALEKKPRGKTRTLRIKNPFGKWNDTREKKKLSRKERKQAEEARKAARKNKGKEKDSSTDLYPENESVSVSQTEQSEFSQSEWDGTETECSESGFECSQSEVSEVEHSPDSSASHVKKNYPRLYSFLRKNRSSYRTQLEADATLMHRILKGMQGICLIEIAELSRKQFSATQIGTGLKLEIHTNHGSAKHKHWWENPDVQTHFWSFISACDPLIDEYLNELFPTGN